MMALSLENKLFDYLAQRHFDLMSPEVRARFDDYVKNGDFQGHMEHWLKNYNGSMTPDLVNDMGGGAVNDHKLTAEEWGELFDAYQEAFQKMDVAKTPSVGFDSEYKKATKDFIEKWFGNFADGKVFVQKTATGVADNILSTGANNLANFLDAPANRALKDVFKRNLKETFSDISYDDFIAGLRAQKYNSDTKFREKVVAVVEYIRDYGPQEGYQAPSRSQWPIGVGYTPDPVGDGTFVVRTPSVNPVLSSIYGNPDTDKWFEIPTAERNVCINRFKDNYTEIFDTLLTKSKVREHFLAQTDSRIIARPLNEALKQTDYENKDSKDYVPEKYSDEKNWRQRFEDFKNDTYENHLRRFVNPSRGTRLYFSPWAQNIIKAFDKSKLKPTDGIEGILGKKDEILKNLASSPTSKDHFEWFTKTIETLKVAGMSKAVEGALRNGKQMRHLVSGIIAEAVEQGKIKEAKTALEVLSVAKYGLSSSRTLNALNEATKDMKIFSDDKLSWNKNEGVQLVTRATDKIAGLAIRGAGLVATGIHNFIQHRRTKIGSKDGADFDISKNKVLNSAHKHWNEEDIAATVAKKRDDAVADLATLAAGGGKSGHTIDAASIVAETAARDAMPAGSAKDNLTADIDLYNKSVRNQHDAPIELAQIAARQANRAADPANDKFRELVAYWNRLESVGKTHAFTLGSMKVKRDAMLKDWEKGTSKAQTEFNTYLGSFGQLRTA